MIEITIDPDRLLVMNGDESVKLSKGEFKLLTHVFAAGGRTLSRDVLLHGLHRDTAYRCERICDSHVKNIRAKLDSIGVPGRLVIQTVYGHGYRFGKERCSVTVDGQDADAEAVLLQAMPRTSKWIADAAEVLRSIMGADVDPAVKIAAAGLLGVERDQMGRGGWPWPTPPATYWCTPTGSTAPRGRSRAATAPPR